MNMSAPKVRRQFVSALLVLLLGLVLSVPAYAKVTIQYLNWTANEIPAEKGLIAEFERTHPDIQVELVTAPVEEMHDKLLMLSRVKKLPDVFESIPEWSVEFAEAKIAAPIESLTSDKSLVGRFLPSAWGMAQWKKKTYGVPWRYGASATFINTRLREATGLPVPQKWTWTEFIEYAKKLTNTEKGVYGFAVPGASVDLGSSWCFSAFLFQHGGRLVDQNGKPAINSREAVEALTFYRDLLKKHRVMPPNTASLGAKDVTDLFANDRVAMWQNGPWYIDTMLKAYPSLKFDVAPLPTDKQDGSPAGGSLISISTQTKHAKEALEFVSYMTSDEVLSKWAQSGHFLPTTTAVLTKPFFQEPPISVFVTQAQQPHTTVIGNLPEFTTLAEALQVATEKVFSGVLEPKAALGQAQKQWEQVFKKYGK